MPYCEFYGPGKDTNPAGGRGGQKSPFIFVQEKGL